MLSRLLLCAHLACLMACGSSSSQAEPQGMSPDHAANETFSASAGASGSFVCPAVPEAFMLGSTLKIYCDERSAPDSTTTLGALTIPNWHGTDTYTFEGLPTGNGSGAMELTIGNIQLSNVGANGAIPATSCTVTARGPAPFTKGSEVNATFHCTNVVGIAVHNPNGQIPQVHVTVDGQVDAIGAS